MSEPFVPANLTAEQVRTALGAALERSAIQVQRLRSNCLRTDAAHAATVAELNAPAAPTPGLSSQLLTAHLQEQVLASANACLANHLELAGQEGAHAALLAEQARILKALV